MMFLYLAILILFLAAFLFSLKKSGEWIKDIDKKENKLYPLYPLAHLILTKTGLEKYLVRKKTEDSIKALYITSKPEQFNKLFWCRRISAVIAVLLLFTLLSVIGLLSGGSSDVLIDGKYIRRPGYGEGKVKEDLNVSLKEPKTSDGNEGDNLGPFDIMIDVYEQSYTEEELDQLFVKSFEYLQKEVLGTNKSQDCIYDRLNFIDSIPGTGIKVDWYPKDYSLIQADGSVINDQISPKGVQTVVTAELSYGKHQKKQDMVFQIWPKQLGENEILPKKLDNRMKAASDNTITDQYLELPDSLDNYRLEWNERKKDNGPALLFLGVVLAIIVWMSGDKELDRQMKNRKEQMLIDYPEIINKFTLLINAGMTIKQAWMKITEDYSDSMAVSAKKRFAYEEMLATAHELKLGASEYTAYEQFGRRTGIISYIKFSSLITQNLKKGTKGFTELLMQEAVQAFEERKNIAKRLGEEAGTKLLMPMMVMLIMVFLIIMIPAFLSFRM
jgi:hypothetical protein